MWPVVPCVYPSASVLAKLLEEHHGRRGLCEAPLTDKTVAVALLFEVALKVQLEIPVETEVALVVPGRQAVTSAHQELLATAAQKGVDPQAPQSVMAPP